MPNLSYEDIVKLALARASEYALDYAPVRSLLYRRASIRQQQLAAAATKANPEYFGVAANAVVTDGAADVNDIASPVPTPEAIQHIHIGAIGAGATVAVGDEVSIVRLGDETAEVKPRVTFRAGILREAVAGDLAGVTSLKVYYAKLPDIAAVAETGATLLVIPPPHDSLLVVDLVKYILMRARLDEAGRTALLTAISAEEAELEKAWLAHVVQWGTTRTRFA